MLKFKKISTILLSLFICLTTLIPMNAFAAFDVNISTIDTTQKGALYITYNDTVEGKSPVAGAEFTMYKVANIAVDGECQSIIQGLTKFDDEKIDDETLEIVKTAYEGEVEDGATYVSVTNSKGEASFQGCELGLYMVEESNPAVDHFASIPFYVELPYPYNSNEWIYAQAAEPKSRPAGHLIVSKMVSGTDGDTNRYFNFTVQVDDLGSDELSYKRSDGTVGTIQNGGTIQLKHGQSAEFTMIPVGCHYTVTEVEADADGYTTISEGTDDYVYRTRIKTAMFNNFKNLPPDTGDTYLPYIMGGVAAVAIIIAVILFIIILKKNKKQKQ